MKRWIALVLMLLTSLTSTPVTFAVATQSFNDVPDTAWYHDAVCDAATLGYFAGTGGGNFSPDQYLTRAMLVQCLAKAARIDTEPYNKQIFKDVTSDKWFFKACNWASSCGLVSGTGGGNFSPNSLLTREQLCVIMVHFREKYGTDFNYIYDYIPFMDDASISEWAHDYVHTLRNTGSVADRVGGYFVPKANVTRAELAVILLSCMGRLDKLPVDPAIHVYGVSLSSTEISVEEGQTGSVTASVLPGNATNATITWSSSDASVATVNGGTISALKPGTAKITATAADGNLSASLTVTVTEKPKPAPYTPSGTRNIDPNKPMLALTFDDGPHKTFSDQILDVLEQYGAVATFFEQGMNVARYPDVIKREIALGCEIGSHTYDHPNLRNISDSEIRSQMQRTDSAFINACGKAPAIMRPPYGARNAHVDSVIGKPEIIWSVDTLDWKYRDADYVYKYVINNAYDGAIILMHSVHGTTAAAVKNIVPALIKQGYQLVTVSELAYYKGYTMKAGGHYSSFK